jgi:hypothetical protein
MPTVAPIPVNSILDNAVNGVASNFINEGLTALPDIGIALLGVAGLFVLFYWTARAFGWHLKRPKRAPSQKGIIGKANKVHLEKGDSVIWNAFSRLGKMTIPGTRRSALGPGFDTGIASGFGSSFDLDDDHDIFFSQFDDDYNDLDTVDACDGFYADPSYNAPYTDDFGPSSRPGAQVGAFAGAMVFFSEASEFYHYYKMDYEDSFNYDEYHANQTRYDLFKRDDEIRKTYDDQAAFVAENWARLFPHLGTLDGLASAPNLSMAESSEMLRHASILISRKQESLPDLLPDITSDDLADMDIDYDVGAYDH